VGLVTSDYWRLEFNLQIAYSHHHKLKLELLTPLATYADC
jgi:hypothetical protein